jgi:hypothetical protein
MGSICRRLHPQERKNAMTDFGYKVPGDEDPTDTSENNVSLIQTGPPPYDDAGEPITDPDGNVVGQVEAPGDAVPEFPVDDPNDRTAFLDDPEHRDIEDFTDPESVPTEVAPDPNMDPDVDEVPIEGGEGAAAPAEPKDG